jgi:hypothetical protein
MLNSFSPFELSKTGFQYFEGKKNLQKNLRKVHLEI